MTTADIRLAEFPRDADEVRTLFSEYAEGLGVDLAFQGFDDEVAGLPGKYAAPRGRLLLAWHGEVAVGCIAMRGIDDRVCEMKRLYVRPQARGESLGRRLVQHLCEEATAAGYSRICLDTLASMATAQKLYASLGFKPVDAYVYNPLPGTQFLALDLGV
ncbi:GNAT family N-acetyltransferase [Dyella mobilis]|uniref:GNAT family N-acetyltransferase n=1 Tax=Dyella mobilis TaxID=1849582 RepID=A0ABS2KJG2_9GAMM|nr:GNAT family N-acetyltransferase [Dyella mobilis]MBM7131302.1 GNAT family N-acetyltransferase [Dyella mobilis]GLQ98762.1 N-acetyltransferase [Dyella mobilis]